MLNSKFGLRQAANVAPMVAGEHDVMYDGGNLSNANSNNNNNNNGLGKQSKDSRANKQQTGQAIETYVIAKYDYQSQGPQELSIKKNDRLLLLDDSRHWWRVLSPSGTTGFVPSNYVKREKQSLFNSIRRGIRGTGKTKKPAPLLTSAQTTTPSSPHITHRANPDAVRDIDNVLSFDASYNSDICHDRDSRLKSLTAAEPVMSVQDGSIKPQSHSDILVKELGPNLNGSAIGAENHSIDHPGMKFNDSNSSHLNKSNDNILFDKNLVKSEAVVKYNYTAQQPDELSLIKNARIYVIEKSDDGWWKGNLDGQTGWFPSNYVTEQQVSSTNDGDSNQIVGVNSDTLLDAKQTSHSNGILSLGGIKQEPTASSATSESQISALFVVIALYSFQSQNEEELSFAKDERLDIIGKPANDPDWWKARNTTGQTGLVPKNYVQIIQKAQLPATTTSIISNTNQPLSATNQTHQTPTKSEILLSDGTTDKLGANVAIPWSPLAAQGNTQPDVPLEQLTRDLEIKLKLNDRSWYHGVMSRQQCDQLLNAYAEDGDFLIRNSETNAGDFSVSLKAPLRNKHFRVHYVDDSFFIGQRKFSSLDELVEHYKRFPIYTSATGEKMFLKKAYER